jgi:hypothetical protein
MVGLGDGHGPLDCFHAVAQAPDADRRTAIRSRWAAMNKCLAQSNKSLDGEKATKKREIRQPGLIRQSAF